MAVSCVSKKIPLILLAVLFDTEDYETRYIEEEWHYKFYHLFDKKKMMGYIHYDKT